MRLSHLLILLLLATPAQLSGQGQQAPTASLSDDACAEKPHDSGEDLDAAIGSFDRNVRPDRAFLGMRMTVVDENGGTGLRIHSVSEGGPADAAGLEPGDVIMSLDGEAVRSGNDVELVIAMDRFRSGDEIALKVLRNGTEMTKSLRAESMPAEIQEELLAWLERAEKKLAAGKEIYGCEPDSTSRQAGRGDSRHDPVAELLAEYPGDRLVLRLFLNGEEDRLLVYPESTRLPQGLTVARVLRHVEEDVSDLSADRALDVVFERHHGDFWKIEAQVVEPSSSPAI